MFNKTKRIIALLMALALVFTLVGCASGDDELSSAEIEYVDNIVYVDDEGNATTGNDANANDNTANDNPQQNVSGNNTSTPDSEKDKNGVDPKDYRGKTVVFATTILSEEDESGPVVDKFEKEYDIKVDEKLVGDVITEVGGMIASGQNVDVIRSCGDFPAVMSIMQPLTAAKLDYSDPIWDQYMFNTTKFGGEPYLCNTIGNIWNEGTCIIYNKGLLKRAGVHTPEEYDAVGKWTWDAFVEIAAAVQKLDGAYGCYIETDYLLGATGSGIYKYENGKYTNGINDKTFVDVMTKVAEWRKAGFVTDSATNPFSNGRVGIVCGLGWSLKRNGSNKDANWNDIGFYYVPSWGDQKPYLTGMLKGWGLVRGSKEPVAGGLFLRYYLDVNNYNTSSAFISDEAEKFFFEFTDTTNSRYAAYTPHYTYGAPGTCNDTITGGVFEKWDCWHIGYKDPGQVPTELSKLSGAVDKAVNNINDHVVKNTGIR